MRRLRPVVTVPLPPVLVLQARQLRDAITRPPDAALPWEGHHEGRDPLCLVALGLRSRGAFSRDIHLVVTRLREASPGDRAGRAIAAAPAELLERVA